MHEQWIEVDSARLAANIAAFAAHTADGVQVAPVVKSNAYGHGLELAARAFVAGGASWLCVHSLDEAQAVAALDLGRPILILGPVPPGRHRELLAGGFHCTVSELAWLKELRETAAAQGSDAFVHLKLETGTHRQGLLEDELPEARRILDAQPRLKLAGLSSHFANVEDTTRHRFAQEQRERFELLAGHLGPGPEVVRHLASSAASILFADTHYDLIRPGIAAYGYWPSRETLASATERGLHTLDLQPALTWKTRITQLKTLPAGAYIGYGRTHKLEAPARIAVLPVGYADGYRRALGGKAWVLVDGRRCPVRGRICMNLIMVDVTHVEGVALGDEAVLLGRQKGERLEVETLAEWAGTIHYEMLAGLSPLIPRVGV